MSIKDFSFCNDTRFRSSIENILSVDLFNGTISASVIEQWYQTFIGQFCQDGLGPYMIDMPSSSVQPSLAAKTFIGHDLPVWMEGGSFKDENRKFAIDEVDSEESFPKSENRLMVIGQDPARLEDWHKGKLTIASPWGLHYPLGYNRYHAKFYNHIVCPLLNGGCSLYVTDFYKLYATNNIKDTADSRSNVTKAGIDFDAILKKEIDLFRPTDIIIMSSNKNVYTPILNAIPDTINCNVRTIRHVAYFFAKGEMTPYYKAIIDDVLKGA